MVLKVMEANKAMESVTCSTLVTTPTMVSPHHVLALHYGAWTRLGVPKFYPEYSSSPRVHFYIMLLIGFTHQFSLISLSFGTSQRQERIKGKERTM